MEPRNATDERPTTRQTSATLTGIVRLACLLAPVGPGVVAGPGDSGRLSYHEAFVAQGAREMLDSGGWANPTIGGRPWLEKPPLPWWLVAAAGRIAGGVDEAVARLPSAIAAALLVLGVAVRGGAALRAGHRPARRRRAGDDGLDRDARPIGRGRRPAGLPDHLGHRRLRPDDRGR